MQRESGINEIQTLYLELIRRTQYNAFDGKKVAHDLVEHQDLWRSVVMWSFGSLITLRNLQDGYHNADTLYIIASPGKEHELEALAKTWNPDTVCYLSPDEVKKSLLTSKAPSVLQCWWD